ncbi:MAG: NADP-dependent malic enzyme [Bacteroidetes bacterium]|nr:NADP-dependent malic enzyme [Bacteroidota bacterium]
MGKKHKLSDALAYHQYPKPGKIEVIPTKKHSSQRDLSLAYSPGVAEPCLAIEKNKADAYKYTIKGNLVAVITNGTAVLGLGDIGPEASKPVMEGKGLLFKIFADIDVFDIELDTKDIDKFVETVKTIAPTFGGINLEDIKAPEAFEIERRLKEELDIPVMHDDQHGTAIISAAALLNAVELAGKKMHDIKMVISGAGAAAISCAKLYKAFGVQGQNMVMFDSKGAITKSRTDLTCEKEEFAIDREVENLEKALIDADVFIGLSKAGILKPQMLKKMAKNPVVFAMANPDPEIDYPLAIKTRKDIIMATGRSDYPNQVNNVLGFPFIFRGALDVRATKINEAMKMAAVKALAELAKEPVPEQVNIAYSETKLSFGRDYIIPKPVDPRLIATVPVAVAKAAIESGVATCNIDDWDRYVDELHARMGSENKIIRMMFDRAKKNPKRVIFAEADHINVIKAAQIVHEEGIAIPILLGKKNIIIELKKEIGFDADVAIIDPKSDEECGRKDRYADVYWKARKRKGVTRFAAGNLMRERNYFAAMMVNEGEADAVISGYSRNYPSVLKPMLELIGPAKNVHRVAATNLMLTRRGPMFLSDTAINIEPDAFTLSKIAAMTARVVKMFGIEPVMAMVSFSNFGSSKHKNATKVAEAVSLLHENYPHLSVDGELQTDFALNEHLRESTFPFSKLSGKKINTLVFPNLDASNITYKLLKELNEADSIGPILMGMRKPVHILQLGASVDEIVNMAAIAVIDAQEKEKVK